MFKTADIFDNTPIPGGSVPAVNTFSGPPATNNSSNAGGYGKLSSVADMQTAMRKLSQDVMLSTRATSPNPAQAETPKGTFNDFLAGHYSENGAQLTEALKQLSGGEREFPVDGKWGPKTSNGVAKIADFADALIKLATEFKIPNDLLAAGKPQWLKNKASEDVKTLSNNEKIENSKGVLMIVDAVNKLYNQVMTQVTKNPFNMKKMEEKTQANKFSPAEEKLMQSDTQIHGLNYTVPKTKQTYNNIPIKALTSKEEYYKYMASIGLTEQESVDIFNKEIKPKVEAF